MTNNKLANSRHLTLKSVKLYRKIGHFSPRIYEIIWHFSLKHWTIWAKNKVYSTFIFF